MLWLMLSCDDLIEFVRSWNLVGFLLKRPQGDDLIEFVRSWNLFSFHIPWKMCDDLIEFVRSWNRIHSRLGFERVMI